jgi:hypothetical protein
VKVVECLWDVGRSWLLYAYSYSLFWSFCALFLMLYVSMQPCIPSSLCSMEREDRLGSFEARFFRVNGVYSLWQPAAELPSYL